VAAAHEFYDYADEHFGWAETAKTERERAIFLQMAAAWLEVAQQWEAGSPRKVESVPARGRRPGRQATGLLIWALRSSEIVQCECCALDNGRLCTFPCCQRAALDAHTDRGDQRQNV